MTSFDMMTPSERLTDIFEGGIETWLEFTTKSEIIDSIGTWHAAWTADRDDAAKWRKVAEGLAKALDNLYDCVSAARLDCGLDALAAFNEAKG